ncbi:MAG: hypothetical protein LBP64_01555 [Tannerella sp.]|nr:hypothetical protein [Tannerella sp.]
MKRIILFVVTIPLILFTGCQSREDKVAKLIRDDMFKTLYDFSSFEPIETIIDSAFTSIYRDSFIIEKAGLIGYYAEELAKYREKANDAISTAEIWSDSYSSYGRSKCKEALKEAETCVEQMKVLSSQAKELLKLIKERSEEISPLFCGWQVKHKFRCKSKGGNFDLGNYLYLFDESMKDIIYKEDLDDESLIKLRKQIESALEYTEEELESEGEPEKMAGKKAAVRDIKVYPKLQKNSKNNISHKYK